MPSKGFSLVELLIGMSLAVVVMTQVISLTLDKLGVQQSHLASLRLQQEIRAITSLIEQQIVMAGYWNQEAGSKNSPHNFLVMRNDCLIFSYDKNNDGSLTADRNEIIAYRLKDKKLQTRNGAEDCAHGRWETLNESKIIEIQSFQIEIDPQFSTCMYKKGSCNPIQCNYVAYQAGEELKKYYHLKLTIQARHRLSNVSQKQHIGVSLNNPYYQTADGGGPTGPRHDCIST